MIHIAKKKFIEEDFIKIVASAKAKSDLYRKLGFDYNSGTLWKIIYEEIKRLSLSIDHFDSSFFRKERRGLSKEITKEELSIQLEKKLTLKQLAVIFTCSQSNIKYWIKKFNLKLCRGVRGKLPKDFLVERQCKCGETDSKKFYGNKTTVCGKCHNKLVLKSGQQKKAFARNHLGGKCIVCDFDKYQTALDIHHLNPEHKDSAFKSMRGWSIDRIIKELKECVLLCRNCHAAHHNGELINDKLSGSVV